MKVYWLEQTEADLPKDTVPTLDSGAPHSCPPLPGDGLGAQRHWEWLSPRERVQLQALRFAKRRADWQLGRWTAKHALAACLCLSDDHLLLANIELRPAASGAPEVFFANQPAPVTISLSHREGVAVCALALESGALGCDMELIEARSDACSQLKFFDSFNCEPERGSLERWRRFPIQVGEQTRFRQPVAFEGNQPAGRASRDLSLEYRIKIMGVQQMPPGVALISVAVDPDASGSRCVRQHAEPRHDVIFVAETLNLRHGQPVAATHLDLDHFTGAVGKAVHFKF